MDNYLLLLAMEYGYYNVIVTWRVYSDQSYELSIRHNMDDDSLQRLIYIPERTIPYEFKEHSGRLSDDTFKKLLALLEEKDWGDPIEPDPYESYEEWSIRYFSEDGTILNSNDNMPEIRGIKHLEEIVGCLPDPGNEVYEDCPLRI